MSRLQWDWGVPENSEAKADARGQNVRHPPSPPQRGRSGIHLRKTQRRGHQVRLLRQHPQQGNFPFLSKIVVTNADDCYKKLQKFLIKKI